jgi:orotate phosphoribosyltransferase
MNQPHDLLQLLSARRGHFQMESGYHSDSWFELDHLFDETARLQPFVRELARRLARYNPDAICGPMTGGAKLAQMIGSELGLPWFAAERIAPRDASSGLFLVKYQVAFAARAQLRGRSVAIVDDAISAGSAVRGTFAGLVACGARPIALGALIIFGDAAAQFARDNHLALEGIARTSFAMWKPGECPLCRAGTAVEKVSDSPKK